MGPMLISLLVGLLIVIFGIAVTVLFLDQFSRVMSSTYNQSLTRQTLLILRVALMIGIVSLVAALLPLMALSSKYKVICAALMFALTVAYFLYSIVSSLLEHVVSLSPFEDRELKESLRINLLAGGLALVLVTVASLTYLRASSAASASVLYTKDVWVVAYATKGLAAAYVYGMSMAIRAWSTKSGYKRQQEPFWLETKIWLGVTFVIATFWGVSLGLPWLHGQFAELPPATAGNVAAASGMGLIA